MLEDRIKARRQMIFELRRPPAGTSRPVPAPELSNWAERSKSLPDLRFQKVQAIKAALASGEYDVDRRLDALFANLPPELAALDSDPT